MSPHCYHRFSRYRVQLGQNAQCPVPEFRVSCLVRWLVNWVVEPNAVLLECTEMKMREKNEQRFVPLAHTVH